ncbi:MAG: response regulator [Burkholderiaceae bacterium]|nr:response regulator [Burkholderiaceae bacterium]
MPSTDPPSSSPLPPREVLARWRRAAESARDGLWEVWPADGQTWFSERFGTLLGHGPGEGPPDLAALMQRIHPEDLPLWEHAWQAAVSMGAPMLLQLRLRDADGDWRWVLWRGRCWLDADGHTEVIAGSLGDVHDEKLSRLAMERLVAERTAGLAQALDAAEKGQAAARHAEQAQARFLAHMSHELRTPLAGLLGLVDLARRTTRDAPLKRYLEVAMQSGQALQRTIDQVLDLTRLNDGDWPLKDEAFDIAEQCAEALRGVMPLVREKGLSVRFDWVGEPTWVVGDVLSLRQIVANLVGNAAKFTTQGFIALNGRLSAAPADPAQRRVEIDVVDTGPGIDPDRVASIFDDFVQGDASLSRAHGGTGLGLTIARVLARRLGGDIAVRTVAGEGSVFTLTLTLPTAPEPDPLPDPPPGQAWLLYRQPAIGEWLQRRLERLGWRCDILAGIPAAMAQAQGLPPQRRPALVVAAEHVLGDADELDALRQALPEARISLLIRPDWDQPALEARAQALGMRLDVMPLTPRDLRLLTQPLGPAAVPAAATQPAAAPADRHVLVVEDNAINRLIAEEFLRTLGVPVRSVEDGAQALQACADDPPALVLMDLQMPVMDGLAATRALCERQRNGALPPFPIVALTAHARAADADACRDAGMQGYLTKPLLLDTLRAELARWWPDMASS